MEIYLLRHASPEVPGQPRICLGQKMDVPLSPDGETQAKALAQALSGVRFDRIFTSPLRRARQTAAILCPGQMQTVLPDLTEVSGGVWDGMPFNEIYTKYPEYFAIAETGGKTPPGGESDEAALVRGLSALETVSRCGYSRALCVTHSGLGRILLCHLLGLEPWKKRSLSFRYAGGYILEMDGGKLSCAPRELAL